MNYTEMLNKVIDESGLKLKDIAEACQKEGVKLTNTYLSSLKTTPGKIASDDISRAIAKVCKARYEDILVIQACLDRAPEALIRFIEIKHGADLLGAEVMKLGIKTSEANDALYEAQKAMGNTLAEYVCYALENPGTEDDMKLIEEAFLKAAEPKALVITAEQMKNVIVVDESKLKDILK